MPDDPSPFPSDYQDGREEFPGLLHINVDLDEEAKAIFALVCSFNDIWSHEYRGAFTDLLGTGLSPGFIVSAFISHFFSNAIGVAQGFVRKVNGLTEEEAEIHLKTFAKELTDASNKFQTNCRKVSIERN